jgi:hypothetical protein
MTPKEARIAAGLNQPQAAVAAGKNVATIRLYEASRDAVSPATRRDLDAYYAGLAARVSAETT